MIRFFIAVLCAAGFAGGAFAYGVDVRKSLDNPCASTFVPLNSLMFRMRQPDGVERIFVRNRDDFNRLHCTEKPWMAVVRPEHQMVNVFTDPSFTGQKTEFCFINGALRYLSVGEKSYEFSPTNYPACTNDVMSLWPAAELSEREKVQNDMWRGGGRLRLLSNNPNRTALIFVQLGLLALAVAFFARSGVWRIHGMLWTFICVVLLVQAASRGGFLAFTVGSAALGLVRLNRGVSRRFLCLTAIIAVIFVVIPMLVKFEERNGGDRSSLSAESRVAIWMEVPRMIKAAPWGWGLWKSGPAYNAWFEKPGNMHMIGDLFNDHFSRIVEGGIVWGGLYVFSWALLLSFGVRLAWRGGSPVPLVIWLAYFVASFFNPMNYWWPSFVIPVGVSSFYFWGSGSIFSRKYRHKDFKIFGWVFFMALVVLLLIGVVVFLSPAQDVPLRVDWQGRRVIVGEGNPNVWLVDDGYVLSGDYYGFPGKEIRAYYHSHTDAEPFGIVTDLRDLPENVDRLVVTGKHCIPYVRQNRPTANHVILLTPPFKSDIIPREMFKSVDLHILTGAYVACLTGDDRTCSPRVHVCPGAETYVPGWLDVVVRKHK